MPSFGKTISGLKDLGSALDGVAEKARTGKGVIGEARAAADEMTSSLDALDRRTEESQSKQAAFRDEMETSKAAISALDGLYAAVQERGNAWSKEFQLQIELVRLGGQSLEDFLAKWGDAEIVLADGTHRVRELLEGVDFDAYERQLQALIEGVREGGTHLAEVLAYLNKNAQFLGQGLAKAVEQFQRGELSLEQLARLLEQYKQDWQGKPLADLADGLLQGLLSGELT